MQINPEGVDKGFDRMCRGGSWGFGESYSRAVYRLSNTPLLESAYIGFRVCLSSKAKCK